jgi:hypothetical protein
LRACGSATATRMPLPGARPRGTGDTSCARRGGP